MLKLHFLTDYTEITHLTDRKDNNLKQLVLFCTFAREFKRLSLAPVTDIYTICCICIVDNPTQPTQTLSSHDKRLHSIRATAARTGNNFSLQAFRLLTECKAVLHIHTCTQWTELLPSKHTAYTLKLLHQKQNLHSSCHYTSILLYPAVCVDAIFVQTFNTNCRGLCMFGLHA